MTVKRKQKALAHGHYECTGVYVVCACGCWNSEDWQDRDKCYGCGQAIFRGRVHIQADIQRLKRELALYEAELKNT